MGPTPYAAMTSLEVDDMPPSPPGVVTSSEQFDADSGVAAGGRPSKRTAVLRCDPLVRKRAPQWGQSVSFDFARQPQEGQARSWGGMEDRVAEFAGPRQDSA